MRFSIVEKQKGFTLIEMIVAMGIFSIMAVAVGGAFSSGFLTYGHSRELQRNVEAAQYAMNTLSKELRTSSIISSSVDRVKFVDYSYVAAGVSGRCYYYRFDSGVLYAAWGNIPDTSTDQISDCSAMSLNPLTGAALTVPPPKGYVDGTFVVTPSDNGSVSGSKVMGRVTIRLVVKESSASTIESRLQTSVSLRDYNHVGF